MNFEIIKVIDNVFWVKGDDQYDLNMLFCRYQEFYESPNPKFRGNAFTLVDFMEWYAKDRDGVFSYPVDWGGFNLTSTVIDDVIKLGIPDPNKYDAEMAAIHQKITDKAWEDYSDSYYLIGSCSDDVIPHELAHGRFYTDKKYRKEMNELVNRIDGKIYERLCQYLTDLGYTKEVFDDEIQAYLSTTDDFKLEGKKAPWQKICQSFRDLYHQYNIDVPVLASYWKEHEKI